MGYRVDKFASLQTRSSDGQLRSMKGCDQPPIHLPNCAGGEDAPPSEANLSRFVADYKKTRRVALRTKLREYAVIERFSEVLRAAIRGLGGKKHPHQRRISTTVLNSTLRRLSRVSHVTRDEQDFEHLLTLIEKVATKGFGKLACYDAAVRIGAWSGCFPKRVYLHAGARAGARAMGLDHRQRSLCRVDIPAPLRSLRPYEIEDFLCVYHDELAPRAKRAKREG